MRVERLSLRRARRPRARPGGRRRGRNEARQRAADAAGQDEAGRAARALRSSRRFRARAGRPGLRRCAGRPVDLARASRRRRQGRTIRSGCAAELVASSPSSSAAIATPIAALASSTSPIAAIRGLALLTRDAVDQPGGAAVAGARVDLVELDHRVGRQPRRRATRIRIDDHDRDRLEQHALAHPVLLPLAGDVLARGHGDDSANEDVGGRGHGERRAG